MTAWEAVLQALLGWPAILASLGASAAGIRLRRPGGPVLGAVLSLGLAWYLTGMPSPLFRGLGYTLPLLHLGAGWAVRRGRNRAAWALLAPVAGVTAYLAAAVLLH